ncbi:MAG: glycosyltransferase family 4 protein [bacterium]
MVCIVEIAGRGGICHYTYNLCKELTERMRVCLVTAKNYELENLELNLEMHKIFNRFKTTPSALFRFFSICSNMEAIHFQLSQYPSTILSLILILKCLYKKKIIVTAHNIISHKKSIFTKLIFKNIYKASDAIIVHAKANKVELLEKFNFINPDKVVVIPHGNYEFFNPTLNKSSLSLLNTSFSDKKDPYQYILFFGYIRRYKGLDDLLEAFLEVIKKTNRAKLLIVGKPIDDIKVYLKKINSFNLKRRVTLDLSYIPFTKVNEYFKKADVVVLPYKKVHQSGVLQLAYGFGKPVVVTNTGGLPEVVEDGNNGFVVPVGNSMLMAQAIINILRNDNLRQAMGNRSLELARIKFNWANSATETKAVYDLTIGRK